MKIAPIMEETACYSERFEQVLVHTGQHYDDEMSQVFFDSLGRPGYPPPRRVPGCRLRQPRRADRQGDAGL